MKRNSTFKSFLSEKATPKMRRRRLYEDDSDLLDKIEGGDSDDSEEDSDDDIDVDSDDDESIVEPSVNEENGEKLDALLDEIKGLRDDLKAFIQAAGSGGKSEDDLDLDTDDDEEEDDGDMMESFRPRSQKTSKRPRIQVHGGIRQSGFKSDFDDHVVKLLG